MKIVFFVIFFLAGIVHAKIGSEGVGGGDPQAIEFIKIGDMISDYLSATNMFPEIEQTDFKSAINKIRSSLDDGKNLPLIKFQEREVVCLGTPKIGCVFSDNTIVIQSARWRSLTIKEKIELVSLEVLQILGMQNRYSTAQSIGDYSKEIIKRRSTMNKGTSCISIAIERSLQVARREYPDYMFMVPVSANYVGIESANEQVKNKYEVHIQVTTADDYSEDLKLEYKFLNKNCVK